MKWFGVRSFFKYLVCPALASLHLTSFCFRRHDSSSEWNRTILCLTGNSRLNQTIKKCAKRIGYNFLDAVQEPALLRDCYRDITIVDKGIFSTHFWQQYLFVQNHTSKDSDKKLLIIVDAPEPPELQMTELVVVKGFPINFSTEDIIETIRAFVRD